MDAEGRHPPARQAPGPFRWRCHLEGSRRDHSIPGRRKTTPPHQDVAVIVDQLNRRRADLPTEHAEDRLLLLAPHVRAQQAAALERAEIDYLDLAGNVHLNAPGLFVHVEGRKPPKEPATGPGRPQKGWIKAVMAILIRPDLVNAPYRALAEEADVALGTIAKCMNDLALRGLLLDQKDGRTIPDRQALVALWVQAYVEGLRPKLKERRFQVRAEESRRLGSPPRRSRRARTTLGPDRRRCRGVAYPLLQGGRDRIYAPIRAIEDRDIQRALVAQPAVRGGNLLIIEPPGPLAVPARSMRLFLWPPTSSPMRNSAIAGPGRPSRPPNSCCPGCWAMSRIEPTLVPVVIDLERGLRELGIPFGIVGALVPELLLDARPARMTNDADVTVVVQSLADFETLKDRLAAFGFAPTRLPQRMQHRSGGLVDLLPFSESIAPDGRLNLEEGFVFNMAGFGQVVPHACNGIAEWFVQEPPPVGAEE